MSAAGMKAFGSIAGAFMKHNARNAQIAEYNRDKYNRDLAAKKRLRIQAASGRQAVADIDRMKVRDEDITADQIIANRLAELRNVASIKSVGGPEGQSTDKLTNQSIGDILRQENAFFKDMDVKNTQYAFQQREIKHGMDMAFLDAQASIDSTRYRRGDGGAGLFMDLMGSGADYYGSTAGK